ncbi:MAG: hypothetical protein M1829_006664 [Trizodia sp. TS-e1964]|nr:MAG: hypothetical protein M1829_006664 [Trizodia sp. TS-e1964]
MRTQDMEQETFGNVPHVASNTGTQIGLTLGILFLTMFVLGFVADPIINLYLDPYNTITTAGGEPILLDDEGDAGWVLHFTKGLASLGLLSFVKVIFAMSPWHWLNLRNSGLMGGGARGNTGRDRLASLNMIVVIIGVGTFLWGVYKGVSAWSRKALEKAGERVVDVHGDNDEDDEAPEEPGSGSNPPSGTTKEEQ